MSTIIVERRPRSKCATVNPWYPVPEAFAPDRVLSPELRHYEDAAAYIVSTIARGEAYMGADERESVRVYSPIQKRVVGNDYAKITRDLLASHTIVQTGRHLVGVRSKGYNLTEEMRCRRPKWVELKDRLLVKRIINERKRMRQEEWEKDDSIDRALKRIQLQALTILPEAWEAIDNLPEDAQLGQEIVVRDIMEGRLEIRVSNTGRRFNGLTGLKRDLRPYVRIGGCHTGEVDIGCAQLALLAVAMHPSKREIFETQMHGLSSRLASLPPDERRLSGLPGLEVVLSGEVPSPGPDFFDFEELVLKGVLYDYLAELCARKGVNLEYHRTRKKKIVFHSPRERVKTLVLQDVVAQCCDYASDFLAVFHERFPSVVRCLKWVNDKRSNADDSFVKLNEKQKKRGLCFSEAIRMLQRLESFIVVEQVCPLLVGRIPIITLHDSIFSRVQDVPLVEQAFYEALDRLGIQLTIKPKIVPPMGDF